MGWSETKRIGIQESNVHGKKYRLKFGRSKIQLRLQDSMTKIIEKYNLQDLHQQKSRDRSSHATKKDKTQDNDTADL